MATVREINDPSALDALAPLWSDLFDRTPDATFLHSIDWLTVYWKHFGAGKRLRVLIVYDRGEAIGILPLVVRWSGRFEPFKVLAYAVDGWGDCYGPIGADPLAVLSAGLEHVLRTRRDWHFIELDGIDALADNGRTEAALQMAGIEATKDSPDARAIVDLTRYESWDAYCRRRGSKWRSNLRQQEKRMARDGEVAFVRYRTSATGPTDPRWDLYDACEAISRASWQHSAKQGTSLSKDPYRQFYRDCHQKAAEFGAVDINLLYFDGQPAAFSYNYRHLGCVTGLKTAFDPKVCPSGAGRVLAARQIADGLDRGDLIYDLGSELTEYKRLWLTDTWPIHRYVHFPQGSPIAQLIRGKRAAMSWWHARRTRAARDPAQPRRETVVRQQGEKKRDRVRQGST